MRLVTLAACLPVPLMICISRIGFGIIYTAKPEWGKWIKMKEYFFTYFRAVKELNLITLIRAPARGYLRYNNESISWLTKSG
jgi:hypothetical protein